MKVSEFIVIPFIFRRIIKFFMFSNTDTDLIQMFSSCLVES